VQGQKRHNIADAQCNDGAMAAQVAGSGDVLGLLYSTRVVSNQSPPTVQYRHLGGTNTQQYTHLYHTFTHIVTLYSKYSRVLTFQALCQECYDDPIVLNRISKQTWLGTLRLLVLCGIAQVTITHTHTHTQ